MKRVLFIAEMNEIVKNMNEAMLPYFQVQLCIADAGMAGQLLHIFQPDIVLIFLSRLFFYSEFVFLFRLTSIFIRPSLHIILIFRNAFFSLLRSLDVLNIFRNRVF